jgi:hypothetical protein
LSSHISVWTDSIFTLNAVCNIPAPSKPLSIGSQKTIDLPAMAQILELHSVDELQRLQQQFPGALVLVYVYKADVDPPVISG